MGPFDEYLFNQGYAQPAPQGQARAKLTPLTPEEEGSLLSRIGDASLGGLGYVGSVLEKTFGGRAIRGVLGGKPRELLSILPGSDTLGLTDEADRVSGKDLLGMGQDDGWLSTVAGIGAELALDPSTYLTLGGSAVSKGGQVARKIGVLPKTTAARATGTLGDVLKASPGLQGAAVTAAGGPSQLAALLHEPLGGVAGLGLPFAHPSLLLGTGQGGADFMSGLGKFGGALSKGARYVPGVGPALDVAGKGLDATGRYLSSWLEPPVMGATGRQGQEAAREAHGLIAPRQAGARAKAAGYAQELQAAGQDGLGLELRATGEGVLQGPAHPVTARVGGGMRSDYESVLAEAQARGLNIQPLRDEIEFMSRQRSPLESPTSGYGGRANQPMVPKDPRVESREDIYKHFTQGTEQGFNRMVLDPDVYAASSPKAAADLIRSRYLNGQGPADQGERLVDILHGLDPKYRASIGTPNELRYFGNHPLADYQTYMDRIHELLGTAEAGHNLLAKTAVEVRGPNFTPTPGSKRVLEALKEAGLDSQVTQNLHLPGPTQAPGVGGPAYLAKLMGLPDASMLSNYMVPAETVADLTRYMRGFSTPESLNPLLRAFDYLTNLTKTFQTAVWPSFHVRNFFGGQHQNAVMGGFEPGLDPVRGIIKPILDAKKLYAGGVIPDAHLIPRFAGRNLTAEQATQELGKEMFALGVSGHGGAAVKDVTGGGLPRGATLEDFLSQIPGHQPKTIRGGLGELATREGAAWNPFHTDTFAPAKAGREIGDMVEGVNRGSLYLALSRQGYTAEEAAKRVLQAHFDYSRGNMTDVEANVLKRLIPFYRYTRENLPFQVRQLMERPGGLTGMEAKVAGDLRQQGGFLPDYLGSGLAMPLGQEDNGTQRYLSRLDLPPEQAFEMLKGGPGGLAKTMMAGLSNLNPMVKAPIEYATGKQFFSGRDLEDLYSMTGNTAAEQILMNSPLGRGMTTLRTLADERKWQDPYALPLNLGTGMKVTDVDMEKQRNIAAREYLTEMLRGQPEVSKFQTLYQKPGTILTPQEEELLRLNLTLEKKAQEASKKKVRVGG